MTKAVSIRLMGDDAAVVEAAVRVLADKLRSAWTETGRAPNRRGPGLRVYGAVLTPDTEADPARR